MTLGNSEDELVNPFMPVAEYFGDIFQMRAFFRKYFKGKCSSKLNTQQKYMVILYFIG